MILISIPAELLSLVGIAWLTMRNEEEHIDHILHGCEGTERCKIIQAGSNLFDRRNPHIWSVNSRVWAEKDSQNRSVGQDSKEYETPGCFLLNTIEGWVRISEALFPDYLGF